MLQLHNLKAGYGELQILQGINLEIGNKELVAVIGPNGAGKSTVLKAIFNLAEVTGGQILFNGKNIRKLPTHQLLQEGISYVPQGRINFMDLTVLENLELGGYFNQQRMKDNLHKVGEIFPILREKKNELAFSLSGGQQQMLALGRALMQEPKLLLLDEPTLGLSPKLQKELFEILRRLKLHGLAILVVEQNAKKAIESADRTYLLEDGLIALTGGREIVHDPKIQQVYLGGR